ncbi:MULTISPECIES: hypothetical protein [Anaerolinea]|uniref:hypothetical protein n=1 Tax=Anaerolinea TaxID=233189 RepID=UPI00260EDAB7|nr:hypothetical protein [Anaerolinea thermophila]
MNKTRIQILIAALVLMLVTLACEFSASTAKIQEVWMSTDDAGEQRTTVYAPDAVFYAQVDLRNAPDDTQLKAVWTAVDVEGADPNTVLAETEFTSGSGQVTFNLTNDQLWPPGTYRVEIYLNGKLDKSVDFSVQ